LWLILQILGAAPTVQQAPVDAGFDQLAVNNAITNLLRNGVLTADANGDVSLSAAVDALIRPSAFPSAVIMASVMDRSSQNAPSRILCFCRAGDTVTANWVDARGDHHFTSYAAKDAGACVLAHLSGACDFDVKAPDVKLPAPTPRDLARAAETMKQAVALTAINATGKSEQAAGWFIAEGSAWLMQSRPAGSDKAPRRASRNDVARAVVELAEKVLMKA
jgi:hypothetical protein